MMVLGWGSKRLFFNKYNIYNKQYEASQLLLSYYYSCSKLEMKTIHLKFSL